LANVVKETKAMREPVVEPTIKPISAEVIASQTEKAKDIAGRIIQ
jgi:hypothetical protein